MSDIEQKASPKNGYFRIANELYDEILHRDFTPRQRAIVDLIMRLSYGCTGKKKCTIEKLSYFDAVGIRRQHVKESLESLIEAKVVIADGKIYSINAYCGQWEIPKKSAASLERLKNLIHFNLKNVTDMVTSENHDVTATDQKCNHNGYSDVTATDQECNCYGSNLYPLQLHDEQLSVENHSENGAPKYIKDIKDSFKNNKDKGGETWGKERFDTNWNQITIPPYDEIQLCWNETRKKKGGDQIFVSTGIIVKEQTRKAIYEAILDGSTFEELKQCIDNFYDAAKKENWLKSPMFIDAFFRNLYRKYLPENYKKKEVIGESKNLTSHVQ